MTRETSFRCELCGQTYDTQETAAWCEQSHVRPVGIIDKPYKYTARAKYPDAIEVYMSDGRIAVYKRKIIP